jgi:DHA2 family multidrug resistance protein
LLSKRDPRLLVFFGVLWMGLVALWRTTADTDMAFWDGAIPMTVMGFALRHFFIPTTPIVLGSMEEREMDSAAGPTNFLRVLSGAAATSVVTTIWGTLSPRPSFGLHPSRRYDSSWCRRSLNNQRRKDGNQT